MASSKAANKAARLASRSGGKSSSKQPKNWLFPLAVVVLVAAGLGIVAYARSQSQESSGNSEHPIAQLTAESQVFDHWHAAFAVDVCGEQLAPLNDVKADLLGIHTHGDDLVHIHPFSLQSAGKRATMARYFDQVGILVSGDTIRLPVQYNGGDTFVSGESKCGGKPAEWVLAHWKDAESAASKKKPDQIYTSGFGDVRFTEDLGAYTLAFVPKADAEKVPPPSSAAQIRELGAVDSGGVPPADTSGASTAPTAPVTTSASTAPATTVKPGGK